MDPHASLDGVNARRAESYGRVVKTLEDLEEKLKTEELQTVREAADALFFCEDLNADPAAEQALAGLYELTDRLVESDGSGGHNRAPDSRRGGLRALRVGCFLSAAPRRGTQMGA